VIGVSFDGTGLGTDGHVWGAEFMVANLDNFKRLYHFDYIPLPGGDKASRETWRMAISYLYQAFGKDFMSLDLPVLNEIENSKILNITQIIQKNINTPLASSAGRLFDAVASIIGVCHFNSFQAEAPMRLESIINEEVKESYDYEIENESISFNILIRQIVNDYKIGISESVIATKFHNTIVELVVKICMEISEKMKINKIVLSGGTFQNVYLAENVEAKLKSKGLKVYLPDGVPVNDQGIALGQLAIAAKKRELSKI
jgi:hydrogenase maturation protein HypF